MRPRSGPLCAPRGHSHPVGGGTTKETIRLEAFSDAVFAIAITFLALDLRTSGEDGVPLRTELLELWPAVVAYVLSFLTILIMWLNHHAMLLWVHRVEGKLMVANGVLLLLVAAVPFPTTVLGENLGGGEAQLATLLYAGLFLLITVAFGWVWLTLAAERRRLAPNLRATEVRDTTRFLIVGAVGYALAAGLAFLSAIASLAVTIGMVGYWLANAYWRHRKALEGETGQRGAAR